MEETGGVRGKIEIETVGQVAARADKLLTVQEIADLPIVDGKVGDGQRDIALALVAGIVDGDEVEGVRLALPLNENEVFRGWVFGPGGARF
jgi:hypothetical protein